jgi:hypothetical protein
MQGFPQFNVIPAMSEVHETVKQTDQNLSKLVPNTMSLSSLLLTKYHILFSNIPRILFSSITLHSAPESFELFSV